jgi:dTDP-4-dehydrorhamnose 3,5-epimerase
MHFEPLALSGLVLVRTAPAQDTRGCFSRAFCAATFRDNGLEGQFLQDSISVNHKAGTLRGMHFQKPPHGETKLVQCVNGAVFDVAVDLRPGSATRGHWAGVTLRAGEGEALYIPEGFAHGFLTLTDNAILYYKITPAYVPGQEGGMRWNDENVGISWPSAPLVISDRDAALPRLNEVERQS